MASELRVNTLKDASGNNSVTTSIIFNGTATVFLKTMGGNKYNFDTQNKLWILK